MTNKINYSKMYRVQRETQAAIRRGVLVRRPCQVCGSAKSEAHHQNYSKPLEVEWLCRKHHGERHRNNHLVTEASSIRSIGKFFCVRCSKHFWSIFNPAKRCGKCKSPYWNIPKKRGRK